jgi:hypothetical protein
VVTNDAMDPRRFLTHDKKIHRAISIRQPYVEQIFRGLKRRECRSRPTHIPERVYVYAALRPAPWPQEWRKVRRRPGDLPMGRIHLVDALQLNDFALEGFQSGAFVGGQAGALAGIALGPSHNPGAIHYASPRSSSGSIQTIQDGRNEAREGIHQRAVLVKIP